MLPGSLHKIVKGAYGLREAPRLWYLQAQEIITSCGFEELRTACAAFVLRDHTKKGAPVCGQIVLHVDVGCHAGHGPIYEAAMKQLLEKFKSTKCKVGEFDFLGRHAKQLPDGTVEIDQHQYVLGLERVKVDKTRRSQSSAPLNAKELHEYRSIVGQLAWPARETMPQLSYAVSDLQPKTDQATVHDLTNANNVLNCAKQWASVDKQKLVFRPFDCDVSMAVVMAEHDKHKRKKRANERLKKLGLAAVHDASFMGQPGGGSQYGCAIMLGATDLYEKPTKTHLLD